MNESFPSAAQELLRRIESRSATVGVIGLGYVGLPLAVEFAKAGFTTIGFDVDAARVAAVNAGRSYVGDISGVELEPLIKGGKLRAAVPGDEIGKCDAISICVPTPLRKSKDPDISYIVAATREVSQRIRPGQLIVLESTTYPGTTTEVLLPELERRGMKSGVDFFLAFSPERVDPGNPVYKTHNTPKVIGGLTAACGKLTHALYSTAVERVVTVSSPEAAEMVKLLENTFRSVNIGLVNEMAIMCRKLGCDVWEVIEAAATKPFGFMPFFPGPGLGGHCIPIDPLYLSWKLKTLNYNARFIELAGEINSHMPDHVADLAAHVLNSSRRSVNGSRVLVLGVAYKRNVSDYRESPALDIMELLRKQGAEVSFSDPHVPEVRLDGTHTRSVPCDERQLAGADLVIVVTDHAAFDAKLIASSAKLVLDTRNLLKGLSGPARIVRL